MGPLPAKIFSIKIDQFVYIFPIFASPRRHYLAIAEPGLRGGGGGGGRGDSDGVYFNLIA